MEKAIFWRICNLLTLNTRPLFVFDGPDVPAKRGRTAAGRKIDYEGRLLLKQVLREFGIPYIEAVGEAEAECCRLQIAGLVDAVWSQDSDCLMFGCTLWIRDHRQAKNNKAGQRSLHKEHTKKDGKTVRVVRAESLKEKCRLDREACVLFAMLAGGDYDTIGLPRCGAHLALKAAQSKLGLSLCKVQNQQDCYAWRDRVLKPFLKKESVTLTVPDHFPKFEIFQHYHRPKVHSDEFIRQKIYIEGQNILSILDIDETRLFITTCHRFNTWGKGYMDWVGPVLLTRALADQNRFALEKLLPDLKIALSRGKKTEDPSERKISFSPFALTILQPTLEHDQRYWTGLYGELFDPNYRVENEVPTYLLNDVVPPGELGNQTPAIKTPLSKRKHQTDLKHSIDGGSNTKKKGKHQAAEESPTSGRKSTTVSRIVHHQSTPHRDFSATANTGSPSITPGRTSCVPNSFCLEDDPELRLPTSRTPRSSTTKLFGHDAASVKHSVKLAGENTQIERVVQQQKQHEPGPFSGLSFRSKSPIPPDTLTLEALEELQVEEAIRMSLKTCRPPAAVAYRGEQTLINRSISSISPPKTKFNASRNDQSKVNHRAFIDLTDE